MHLWMKFVLFTSSLARFQTQQSQPASSSLIRISVLFCTDRNAGSAERNTHRNGQKQCCKLCSVWWRKQVHLHCLARGSVQERNAHKPTNRQSQGYSLLCVRCVCVLCGTHCVCQYNLLSALEKQRLGRMLAAASATTMVIA